MLYNESRNTDYINMFLKRLATDDEINLLEQFWKEILPYRFFKGFYHKLSEKNIFLDKNFKKVKIKNHRLFLKSSFVNGEKNGVSLEGDIIKGFASCGIQPNGISCLTSIKSEDFKETLKNYAETVNVPVVTAENTDNEGNSNSASLFGFSLIKKKRLKKQKIKNGVNIFIVGSFTDVENPSEFDIEMHKKLTAFCLESRRYKLAKAAQTCEQGIFTALIKLLQKKKWGIFANIDNLHKTVSDLETWRYMTAKNNDRLMFAVSNRKLVRFINLLDKYELPFSIIGKVDKSKMIRVMSKGKLVINLPKKLILNPVLKINNFNYKIPEYGIFTPSEELNGQSDLIINNDTFQEKNSLIENFNSELGGKTSLRMTNFGVAELYFPKIKYYVSTATTNLPLQIEYNPYVAGQNLVFEAVRKIIAIGHKPVAISVICNINFLQKGEIKRFDAVRKGFVRAAKKLKIKILNVHIFKTEEKSDYSVNIIGKRKADKPAYSNCFYMDDEQNKNKIYLIGKPDNLYATSEYQRIIDEPVFPCPDETNLRFEKRLLKSIKYLQKGNLINACIPVERFGIAGALLKGLKKNELGFCVANDEIKNLSLRYLFNETQSRFLIQTDEKIEPVLKKLKIPFMNFGDLNNSGFVDIGNLKFNII